MKEKSKDKWKRMRQPERGSLSQAADAHPFYKEDGVYVVWVCLVFALWPTTGIQTWNGKNLAQTPGLTLFTEQLNVYVLGKAVKTKPHTYLAQPATASCNLWLSDAPSVFSFSENSFCRGQIMRDWYLLSLGPLSFRSIQYLTTASFGWWQCPSSPTLSGDSLIWIFSYSRERLEQCWSGFIYLACKRDCKRMLKPVPGWLAARSHCDMLSKVLVLPETLHFFFMLFSGISAGTELITGANQCKEAYGKFLVQWKIC